MDKVKWALIRLIRVLVPQIPTVIVWAQNNPNLEKFLPLFILLGGILTALDKYLRSIGLYGQAE